MYNITYNTFKSWTRYNFQNISFHRYHFISGLPMSKFVIKLSDNFSFRSKTKTDSNQKTDVNLTSNIHISLIFHPKFLIYTNLERKLIAPSNHGNPKISGFIEKWQTWPTRSEIQTTNSDILSECLCCEYHIFLTVN